MNRKLPYLFVFLLALSISSASVDGVYQRGGMNQQHLELKNGHFRFIWTADVGLVCDDNGTYTIKGNKIYLQSVGYEEKSNVMKIEHLVAITKDGKHFLLEPDQVEKFDALEKEESESLRFLAEMLLFKKDSSGYDESKKLAKHWKIIQNQSVDTTAVSAPR